MKKILLTLMASLCILMGHAQNKFNLSGISSLTNFGIDYSLAKVYGGKETGYQYWITYADINEQFIAKPKMFDISKRLGIPVEVTSLEAVNKVNKEINPDLIITDNPDYLPTEAQISDAVKKLPILSQEEKYGIVILCLSMNKERDLGTYQFVVFNTKTRDIIEQWTNTGKGLGLNLKQYWAHSVYQALRKIKYRKGSLSAPFICSIHSKRLVRIGTALPACHE